MQSVTNKFFNADKNTYQASPLSEKPPFATAKNWQTIHLESITLTLLNRLANLHNKEMAGDHDSVRKLLTVSGYSVGMVLSGVGIGSTEMITRLALAILLSPLLAAPLINPKNNNHLLPLFALLTSIENGFVITTALKSAYQCLIKPTNVDVSENLYSTSFGFFKT